MKNRCPHFLLLLCALLLLTVTAAGAGNSSVNIRVNGIPLQGAETAYISENGVTMVPLRAVSEALGVPVYWDQDTRTVSVGETSALVVLDPGHGGASTGASYGGVSEKDLNLSIAQKTAAILEGSGLTVVLTRTGDRDVGLYDRTALAGDLGAEVFVSIHCNASLTNPEAAGIYTAAYGRGSAGWDLSEALRRSMTASTGAADMGAEERPDLAVLRTASMPAALVECGYMSTPAELELLARPEYQELLARGIADGVLAFLAPGR